MPAFSNQSGTEDLVLNVYAKSDDEWALAKAAYVNNGGTWEQFYSNHSYQLYALGDVQTVYDFTLHGLYMDGELVFAGARSYNIVLFDNYGNVTGSATYDVFGDAGATGAGTNTQNMIDYLNSLISGQIYLIFSVDEPSTGAGNLTSTLTSFFGGTATILSASIPYRGAYMAFGKKGLAPWIETYCGTEETNFTGPGGATVTGTPDGVFNVTFQIYTTAGPSGQFVNLDTIYQGSAVVTNDSQTGMPTVAGLAT
jgi:hypothetical protein